MKLKQARFFSKKQNLKCLLKAVRGRVNTSTSLITIIFPSSWPLPPSLILQLHTLLLSDRHTHSHPSITSFSYHSFPFFPASSLSVFLSPSFPSFLWREYLRSTLLSKLQVYSVVPVTTFTLLYIRLLELHLA